MLSIDKLAVEHEFDCGLKPSCIEISPDGKWAAVGSYQWTDKILILNLETKELVQTIEDARCSHQLNKGKETSILIKIPPRFV